MRPTLIITVPCFNEEAVLGETVGRLSALLDRMRQDPDGIAPESWILLVNDGSTDTTRDIIRSLHETNSYVCGINLAGNKPVRLIFEAGMLLVLISLGILIYILCAWANGQTVSGWTSLILSVWFLGGLVLLSIGVVGEYIGKIYLEVKDRPRFIIESKLIK